MKWRERDQESHTGPEMRTRMRRKVEIATVIQHFKELGRSKEKIFGSRS